MRRRERERRRRRERERRRRERERYGYSPHLSLTGTARKGGSGRRASGRAGRGGAVGGRRTRTGDVCPVHNPRHRLPRPPLAGGPIAMRNTAPRARRGVPPLPFPLAFASLPRPSPGGPSRCVTERPVRAAACRAKGRREEQGTAANDMGGDTAPRARRGLPCTPRNGPPPVRDVKGAELERLQDSRVESLLVEFTTLPCTPRGDTPSASPMRAGREVVQAEKA